MRHRATGILFVLSGTCFLAGVLDPPILPTWGGSAADVMATGSAHRRRGSPRPGATLSIEPGWPQSSFTRTLDTTWPGSRSLYLCAQRGPASTLTTRRDQYLLAPSPARRYLASSTGPIG